MSLTSSTLLTLHVHTFNPIFLLSLLQEAKLSVLRGLFLCSRFSSLPGRTGMCASLTETGGLCFTKHCLSLWRLAVLRTYHDVLGFAFATRFFDLVFLLVA